MAWLDTWGHHASAKVVAALIPEVLKQLLKEMPLILAYLRTGRMKEITTA